MATVTIVSGPMSDDLGTRMNVQSPRPPLSKSTYDYSKELIVGTDFQSGDDVVLSLPSVTGVEWASFTGPDGTVINYTEASLSPLGKSLTLAAVTTNVKAHVIAVV